MGSSPTPTGLDRYLEQIAKVDLLDPDEEAELARTIRTGTDQEADEAARELVRSNLRFVVSVAKEYQGQGLELRDLIHEGNLGLMKAARRFDESRGFKFISYAVWWIRQSIMQALSEQTRVVRLPAGRVRTISRMNKAETNLEQTLERPPTFEELAEELDEDAEHLLETRQHETHGISVDAPVGEGESAEGGSRLLDVLPDAEAPGPDDGLEDHARAETIEYALESLSPREADILRQYFGMHREHPMTLEEIGETYDVTRERIRQIKEKALTKLRDSSYRDSLAACM